MRERPILFSAPMVRALLAGTKIQTRRVCKPAQFYAMSSVVEVPDPDERGQVYNCSHFGDEEGDVQFQSPYGGRGDRLWVRESWAYNPDHPGVASRACFMADPEHLHDGLKWKPSIHTPRAVCRITLEITGVRVERLQDISEADAVAEGLTQTASGSWLPGPCDYPEWAYHYLWEQINGPGSWEANPWVWVVEFRRLT